MRQLYLVFRTNNEISRKEFMILELRLSPVRQSYICVGCCCTCINFCMPYI